MECRALPVPADPTDPELLQRLSAALAGDGPLLLPYSPDAAIDLPRPGDLDPGVVPTGGGIAVGTSGSTGTAKRAVLPAQALAASADATHARLGGAGQWLLALPAHHIAGLQVVLRSLRAGTTPAVVAPGSFTPAAFAQGVRSMTGSRRYTSLVPTQLIRLLDDEEALGVAQEVDAILVGGSAVSPVLLHRARDAGLPVVVTYGMSETAGGCVYDGEPLAGVHLRIEQGRIHLAGDVVATGYLGRAREGGPFAEHGGLRWFRTDDIGHLTPDGLLVVDGRADDVIVSGGMKVWPAEVERALAEALPPGCDLAVVGLPDVEWGQRVAVAVECGSPSTTELVTDLVTDLLDHARAVLTPHARPRVVRVVSALPRLGPGKPDRARLVSLLMDPGWEDGTPTTGEEG